MKCSNLWCLSVHIIDLCVCLKAETEEFAAELLVRLVLVVLELVGVAVQLG